MSIVITAKTKEGVVMVSDGQTVESMGRISNLGYKKCYKLNDNLLFGAVGDISTIDYVLDIIKRDNEKLSESIELGYYHIIDFFKTINDKVVGLFGEELSVTFAIASLDKLFNVAFEGKEIIASQEYDMFAIGAECQTAVSMLRSDRLQSYDLNSVGIVLRNMLKDLSQQNIYIGGEIFTETLSKGVVQ